MRGQQGTFVRLQTKYQGQKEYCKQIIKIIVDSIVIIMDSEQL